MKPLDQTKNILMTGGTGFVGSSLRPELLKEGHYVTTITRNPAAYREVQSDNQRFIGWDDNLVEEMERADVVIHMAGENIFDRRWTRKVKREIYESRILTTDRLVNAMAETDQRPEVFISASGVGFYGDRGEKILSETDGPGGDFMAVVCKNWERVALTAEDLGVRVAIPRFGMALQKDGGILGQMILPFQFYLGGSLGSGQQYIPWIHMRDLCRAIYLPVEEESLTGPYNACSPQPATMDAFTAALGRVMNRPVFARVPAFLLHLALGEFADSALASLRVQPVKLQTVGMKFEFRDLEESLADLL